VHRRLAIPVLVAALAFAPGGAAKEEPRGVRICGSAACRVVSDRDAVRLMVGAMSGPATGLSPSPLAAFFTIDVLASAYGSEWYPRGYFIPATARVRSSYSHVATWSWAGSAGPPLRAATLELVPFARPRIARVEVDGRAARDPASYERVYTLRGAPALDAAGDAAPDALWGERLQHLRRDWLPVNLWTARPSPWGDGANFVWLSRRGSVLKRDGELVRIPAGLAERIRRGASLR
jgi:hypothetical protein